MVQNCLTVKNLKMYFPVGSGLFRRSKKYVKAVDDVSFSIEENKVLGLVGESGCGKTTVGRSIVRIYNPSQGSIEYTRQDGSIVDIAKLKPAEMQPYHKEIRMVFQDPFSSLNPRLPVKDIIAEPIVIHRMLPRSEIEDRVSRLMGDVGLNPDYMQRYPHEFSGGQRQRIGIARALASNPRLIVADEPVSALDVSVQAQVLNLMETLRDEKGLTFLFVAHDISVVEHISDNIAVMYVGRIVEQAETEELLYHPLHPYTEALVSAIPVINSDKSKNRIHLEGDVPNPVDAPSGCVFHPRCRYAGPECSVSVPELREAGDNHQVACHNYAAITLKGI
ncbi:MAG: ATP-binding cassette domain-containing protein [Treponema sp.]|nr:ATP-binding cassette domain-containing protein [Treponema sp.]